MTDDLPYTATLDDRCARSWGSHACSYRRGHDGTVHRCWVPDDDDPGPLSGVCCEYDEAASTVRRVRFTRFPTPDDPSEWGAWDRWGVPIDDDDDDEENT